MKFVDNDQIRSVLIEISKKIILPNFRNLNSNQINYKNNKDIDERASIVTSVDIEVEKHLKKILPQFLKNSHFIGEEIYTHNPEILDYYNQKKYCWTVDPIDGTLNFVKGKELFAVMVALTFSNQIIQSWIYKPITEEFMYAKLNQGSYLNNKKITINNFNSISNSVGSISSKYWDKDIEKKIKLLKNNFKDITSYGSIGCEYFDIVLGKRDFVILSKLSPWDHLSGVLLVREAGGNDSHFNNLSYKFNQKSNNLIVSSSRKLNIEIINKIKELES